MRHVDNWEVIEWNDCKVRHLYLLRSRNLSHGVYDGEGGFIGIREKFGQRYLFTEYHWDSDPHFGTANPVLDLGEVLNPHIELKEFYGPYCSGCGRPIEIRKAEGADFGFRVHKNDDREVPNYDDRPKYGEPGFDDPKYDVDQFLCARSTGLHQNSALFNYLKPFDDAAAAVSEANWAQEQLETNHRRQAREAGLL